MFEDAEGKKEVTQLTELDMKSGNSEAKISPEKGGMVTSWVVDGEEMLDFDQEAFEDLSNKKPKAGIPALIPYPSNIDPDIKLQHGGAREVPWLRKSRDEKSITISLDSQDLPIEMRDELKYIFGPDYEYGCERTVSVDKDSLKIETVIENKSKEVKQFSAGEHPYWKVDHTKRHLVTSNLPGFDPSNVAGNSLRLKRPEGEDVWVKLPDGRKITISASPQYKYFVVWANKPDSDHICVEPFVSAGDTPEERQAEFFTLEPGQREELWVEFKVSRAE
jgi:galactose mutarotase-like enzyme